MTDKYLPKKYLGQNFLIDTKIQERIIDSCNIEESDIILEIGPGMGAITKLLSAKAGKVIAIEKDRELASNLIDEYEGSNVEIIHEDILKYDFSKLPKRIKIISNLPYNIATPIIEKVIKYKEYFTDFFMTVQFEYGERITAKHNQKNYGTFTCFVQYYCDSKLLFNIRNTAFRPVPKVKSCFLHLEINKTPKIIADDEKLLFRVIKQVFKNRRKTIENALSGVVKKNVASEILSKLQISAHLRAENINLQSYIELSNSINKLIKK